MVNASSTASVEHCLDVLPGMQASLVVQQRRRRSRCHQFEMTTPRVEVGGVRVVVGRRRRGVGRAMIVEDELVGRQEHVTVTAAYALSSRTSTQSIHTSNVFERNNSSKQSR